MNFKLLAVVALTLLTTSAQAGIFSIPKFLEPKHSGFGFEPEYTLTSGGGIAANIRYQYGVNDLSNMHVILGAGDDPRKFRIGGAWTFDAVPDIDRQPGVGLALMPIYYRYSGFGQLDLTVAPYVHKAFYSGKGSHISPFFAFPFGPEVRDGDWNWAATAVFGAMFKSDDLPVHFIGEVGVKVDDAESYISAGVLFTP